MLNVCIRECFYRQKVYYTNGYCNPPDIHSNEIPDPRPYNSCTRFHCMGIDNRSNCVGRIMKSINKFKCQG